MKGGGGGCMRVANVTTGEFPDVASFKDGNISGHYQMSNRKNSGDKEAVILNIFI